MNGTWMSVSGMGREAEISSAAASSEAFAALAAWGHTASRWKVRNAALSSEENLAARPATLQKEKSRG